MSSKDIFNLKKDIFSPKADLPFACDVHLNHFTDTTLTMFLEKSGFKVIENGCDYLNLPGGAWINRLIKRVTDLYTRPLYLLTFKRKLNFASELMFAARKIRDI
ncbi:MAG: hypothetical protein MUO43_14395 [Desulfobacterales bacterium]|nr:hypothetical protein [Desulfobacterales bacterium]